MPPQNSEPTILVLDSELGFLLALSHELSRRHMAAFPACSVREAEALIAHYQLRLDVVVVNCARPGVCGFAEAVCKKHPETQVVGIVSERHQCRQCAPRLAVTMRDPEDRGPERIGHCADVIQMLVKGYRRRAHRAGEQPS